MKKDLTHNTRTCAGIGFFEVEYDQENVPYLKCNHCNAIIDDWIKWKNLYSSYWSDNEKWSNKRDHIMCLLSWFAELYRRHYSIDFTLSLTERGLFRSKEVHFMRKLLAMLDNDAFQAKEYLTWIFDNKVVKRKKKITSLGFLVVSEVIQEYKLYAKKNKQVYAAKLLPAKMKEWIASNAPDIETNLSMRDFGELNIALNYYKSGQLTYVESMPKFVDRLKKNNIVNENLEIVGWSNA